MKNVKFDVNRSGKAVTINTAMLNLAVFRTEEALSAHVNDGLILLFKAKLTAKDLVDLANNLYLFADDLMERLVRVCGSCEECEKECDGFNGVDLEEPVQLSEELREAIGVSQDGALDISVDEKNGTITVKAANDKYSLYSVPHPIMEYLMATGICLGALDQHLRQGDVVYGD